MSFRADCTYSGSARVGTAREGDGNGAGRGRWRNAIKTAALLPLVITFLVVNVQTAAGAADAHPYPRLYHIWSCSYPDKLARYDLIVGYSHCDVARMRTLNPAGIFLLQPNLNGKNLHLTYGAAGDWKGGTDTISDGAAANLGYIRPFDTYWDRLHNANGTVATLSPSYPGAMGFNMADPLNKGTEDEIAKIFAYAAKSNGLYRNGWDGLFADNWDYSYAVCTSWFFGKNWDTDRNKVTECSPTTSLDVLKRNWDNGIARAGTLLRQWFPGKSVGGNGLQIVDATKYEGTTVDGWLKSTNYGLLEGTESWTASSFIPKANQWINYADPYNMPRYFSTLHAAKLCDGTDLKIPDGEDINSNTYMLNSCVMKWMRWGLTMALMTGAYYEYYPRYKHGALWYYDEYDGGEGVRKRGYLGLPVNDPQKLANGIYRRDFANGLVLHNPTTSALSVSVGAGYKKLKGTQNPTLNNGASVTSVSIPAKDGIILLRTTASFFAVSSKTPTDGQTVSGSSVPWEATVSGGTASKVEFLIDGVLKATDTTSPYVYTWNTTTYPNGARTLSLKATATDGRTATSLITANVANGTFAVSFKTPTNGQTVGGTSVSLEATVSGKTASKVEFSIDGALKATDTTSPYTYTWNTTTYSDGPHTLSLKATATDGSVATSQIGVTVSNGATGFTVSSKTPTNGQTVSGSVVWEATVSGGTASKVEFSIDGVLKWTESGSPYLFNNGTWNTTTYANGSHTLTLKAIATDGRVATSSIVVTVSNFAVASKTPLNGQTVRGSVVWEATVSGGTASKVEFFIDGVLKWTESGSPYLFNNGTWNTTTYANGSHTLMVKATASDGRVATSSISVTVSN